MGSACCCMREDSEDYTNPNSSIYRNCICLHCFIHNFLHMYTSIFRRDVQALPSIERSSSLSSSTLSSLDTSLSDMFQSPPRPLPYDADPRVFCMQRDSSCSRRENVSSHSQEESELLQRSETESDSEPLITGSKWKGSTCEDGPKEYHSKRLTKVPPAISTTSYVYNYSSSEDEDVCPTCLEEYTTENPKIITHCSHHFHLGCIYEWMERSETCPVCGKVMAFDETT